MLSVTGRRLRYLCLLRSTHSSFCWIRTLLEAVRYFIFRNALGSKLSARPVGKIRVMMQSA